MKRIVFVGGASGGHFYPLMAVADALRTHTPDASLYYIGPSPYKKELLAQYGITYISCPAGKIRRYFSLQNIVDVFRSFFGIFVAIYKLYILYPDVIFSKGSYTAVPILIAARFLRIPVVIHESDSKPGRANRIARSFARYIGIAYDDVAAYFPKEKTALIGIPLRKEILIPHTDPFAFLGIPPDKPLLYVTGGSQGAEKINTVILQSLGELLPHYRVFHQVGDANVAGVQAAAKIMLENSPYSSNYFVVGSVAGEYVSALLDAAALVITRAGSTTLFEIAAHGVPAIIIPIPEDVSHDQRSNAYAYARNGAASVIEEMNLTDHLLSSEISSIISNPTRHSAMETAARALAMPDASEKIASLLISITNEHV
jgi:UDP-N-acetylglucosamine--N-acetylmuramyl-(pentapeptide) pyrophosphoryl-undecaprenol N-acetylglucosamine transferase